MSVNGTNPAAHRKTANGSAIAVVNDDGTPISSGGASGNVKIEGDTSGNVAEVDASNNLCVKDSAAQTSLASIDSKVATEVTLALLEAKDFATQTTLAAILSAMLPDGHNVTVDNGPGGAAINIQDGGNSITIDAASLPLPTGAATEATLALLEGKDFATQTTLAAILAAMLPDGHNVTVDNTADIPVKDVANTAGQRNTLSISTIAVPISNHISVPLANRKAVRIAPIDGGRFYWGFSNAVTAANAEYITRQSPLNLSIGTAIDVYLIRASGSGTVAIYEVS